MLERNELIQAAFALRNIAENRSLPLCVRLSSQRNFETLAYELSTKHNIDRRFWDARETIHCL